MVRDELRRCKAKRLRPLEEHDRARERDDGRRLLGPLQASRLRFGGLGRFGGLRLLDPGRHAAVEVGDLIRRQAVDVGLVVVDPSGRHDVRLLEAVARGLVEQLLQRHLRRDDRERRDELRRLRAALEVALPGELLFVGLDARGARVRLPQHLEGQGLARPWRYLNLKDGPVATRLHELPAALSTLVGAAQPGPALLFVDGLDHLAEDAALAPGGPLEQLTLAREALAQVPAAVVFLMPIAAIDQVRTHAVNLWSWRAYDFTLHSRSRGSPPSDERAREVLSILAAPGCTEVAAVAGVAYLTGVVPIDAIHRYLKAGMVHPVPRWAWNLGGGQRGGQRGGRHKERADQVLTPSRDGG